MTTLTLVLVLITLLPACAAAQSSFKVVKQDFDQAANDWGDTIEIMQVWKNQHDILDSIYTYDPIRRNLGKFYKWTSVSNVLEGTMHNIPHEYSRLGARGKVPRESKYYNITNLDSNWTYWDTIEVKDTRVVKHYSESFSSGLIPDQSLETFDFTDYGELYAFNRTTSINGVNKIESEGKLIREYDALNRVSSVVRSHRIHGTMKAIDSQAFVYESDNTLRTATSWGIEDGQLSNALRIEFFGWQMFQPRIALPNWQGALVGGDDFKLCSYFTCEKGKTTFRPDGKREKQYDAEGRVTTNVFTDTLGSLFYERYQYYPNDDFKEYRKGRVKTRDSVHHIYSNENVYSITGEIESSVQSDRHGPVQRYIFGKHSALNVQSTAPTNQSFTLSGHVISFGASEKRHSVCVVDLLGSVVHESTGTGHVAQLPSYLCGLYFISINGGKPRKHLIP